MTYPTLAGDRDGSAAAPPQLFVGDGPIVTDSAPALADIVQWQVCALTPTGVTPYVIEADPEDQVHTPDQVVVAQVGAQAGQQCPYYSAAKLNHALLVWPESLDTLAKRKAFVQGTMIQVGHLI